MKRIELPKETHPNVPEFNIRPYTPKVRKRNNYLAMEWTIDKWIRLYEELVVASRGKDKDKPANLELRAMAKEIRDEILNNIPPSY